MATKPDAPATPDAQTLTTPGAATVSVTPTPIVPTAPGPRLITKIDERGNEQSLPQATWDALGAANLATYSEPAAQPEKPASLV